MKDLAPVKLAKVFVFWCLICIYIQVIHVHGLKRQIVFHGSWRAVEPAPTSPTHTGTSRSVGGGDAAPRGSSTARCPLLPRPCESWGLSKTAGHILSEILAQRSGTARGALAGTARQEPRTARPSDSATCNLSGGELSRREKHWLHHW